jgi:hypothetical protein
MRTNSNPEPDGLSMLRELGDDVPATDPAAKARARARLDGAIERERREKSRRPLRWGAVAAAALALILGVSELLRGPEGGPAAALAIRRLAAVASEQPPAPVPAGSFVYSLARVRATSTDVDVPTGEAETTIVTSERETWIAADGSGLIIERPAEAGSGEARRTEAEAGTLRYAELDRLPTDPHPLLEAIRGPGFLDEPEGPVELLSGVGALLRDSYASPTHREALFLIVAGIDGVEITEDHRDALGRLGTAVSFRDGLRSVTLVFEPGTSRLLAEADEREGGTLFEATYIETAVVATLGDRPGG